LCLAVLRLRTQNLFIGKRLSAPFHLENAMSKEEIIAAIQESATKMGRVPTFTELCRATQLGKHEIRKHFLTYAKALGECGLQRTGPGYEADLTTLFVDWAVLVRKLKKVPTMAEYEMHGCYSVRPFTRRFGGWVHVPAGLMEYAREAGLETEWEDVLDVIAKHTEVVTEQGRMSGRANGRLLRSKFLKDQPTYGPPLIHMPLCLAPTNELGVVFVFGTVARELGFMVMRLQAEFPDCEALRQVEPGRWQRVRIEFEFESRNFLTHQHAVTGCDLIVCWRHNWPGCPLEVVELGNLPQICADWDGHTTDRH
jgi:Homing endonuclease associated repeat